MIRYEGNGWKGRQELVVVVVVVGDKTGWKETGWKDEIKNGKQ